VELVDEEAPKDPMWRAIVKLAIMRQPGLLVPEHAGGGSERAAAGVAGRAGAAEGEAARRSALRSELALWTIVRPAHSLDKTERVYGDDVAGGAGAPAEGSGMVGSRAEASTLFLPSADAEEGDVDVFSVLKLRGESATSEMEARLARAQRRRSEQQQRRGAN
jgi:hypothetical protein